MKYFTHELQFFLWKLEVQLSVGGDLHLESKQFSN